MPAHRKNFDAAVEMYLSGKSLADVAKCFGVTRQSMWKVISRRVAVRPQQRLGQDNHFYRHGQGYAEVKRRATLAVNNAVRSGKLIRQPCERCGSSARGSDGRSLVHAHHEDYLMPLSVRWLCVKCHHAEHLP